MMTTDQSRFGMPAVLRLAFLAAALASGRLIAEEYPSEAWVAHPSEIWTPVASEPWSPRIASLPTDSPKADSAPATEGELPVPSSALPNPDAPLITPVTDVFSAPPLEMP